MTLSSPLSPMTTLQLYSPSMSSVMLRITRPPVSLLVNILISLLTQVMGDCQGGCQEWSSYNQETDWGGAGHSQS